MALVTTVGAADADSYADVAYYKSYWAGRLFNTVQLAASDTLIEGALKWACRLQDAAFVWKGAATDDVQALAFPRRGLLTANGYALAVDAIPNQLKNAQCEFAGILITGDRTADNASLKVMGSETTLTSLKAGPVSLTFAGGNFSTLESFDAFVRSLNSDLAYLSKIVPDSVRLLISPNWYKQASLKRKLIFAGF